MTISERLDALMREKKITRAEVSEVLSVSDKTVAVWVKNNKPFSAEYIMPLSKFLGVSPVYLLTGEEESQPIHAEKTDEYSETEKKMIEYLRKLDTEGRILVMAKVIEELRRAEEDRTSKGKDGQPTSA